MVNNLIDKNFNMLDQNRRKFDDFFQRSCSSTDILIFVEKKTTPFSLFLFLPT